jgi:hypothetical protein
VRDGERQIFEVVDPRTSYDNGILHKGELLV